MGWLDRLRSKPETPSDYRVYTELKESLAGLGLSFIDVQLGLSDLQWMRLGTQTETNADLDQWEREELLRRSRVYYQRDPLIHRAVRMTTEWVFPELWSVRVANGDPTLEELVNLTRRSPANRGTYSFLGTQKRSDQLQTDGELFLAFFVGPSSEPVRIRRIDPLQIVEIVTNPNDVEDVWGYVREIPETNGGSRRVHYVDWDADDIAQRSMLRRPGSRRNVYMAHFPIQTLGQRGFPIATSAMDWAQTHRRFMEDRATLTRALATFAFQGKTKGGAGTIDRLKSALQFETVSSEPTGGQPPPAGSTAWQSGMEFDQFKVNTGAGNASVDGLLFRLMVSAGTGLPELFLTGNTADANLASASVLIRPLENLLVAYQNLWFNIHRQIYEHVAMWQSTSYDPAKQTEETFLITGPPVTKPELSKLVDSISKMIAADPRFKQIEIYQRVLEEMLVQDAAQVAKNIDAMPEPQPTQVEPAPVEREGGVTDASSAG